MQPEANITQTMSLWALWHAGVVGAVQHARDLTTGSVLSPAEQVHAIRRSIKHGRALLAIVPDALRQPARKVRSDLKEVAHILAPMRDAQAMRNAIAGLRKARMIGQEAAEQALTDRTTLADTRNAIALRTSLRRLNASDDQLKLWSIAELDDAEFEALLADEYGKSRRLQPDDYEQADAGHLHNLRSAVIRLRYQIGLIPGFGDDRSALIMDLDRMRRHLGDHHDLDILATHIKNRSTGLSTKQTERMLEAIHERQANKARKAANAAERVFEDKPRHFRKRLARAVERYRFGPAAGDQETGIL
jgi:CHAD domain-containing protein